MDIEQLRHASQILKEHSDDDRDDINAGAAAPFLMNVQEATFENDGTESVDSSSFGHRSGTARHLTGESYERIRDLLGNYITNETMHDGEDHGLEGIRNMEEQISDENFRLDHNGLSREEWDDLMLWLRDNGLGWVADTLEANPEHAAEILDMLMDPDGYWDTVELQAWEMQDEYHDQLWVEFQDRIMEALGYTLIDPNDPNYNLPEGGRYYRDAEGNVYFLSPSPQTDSYKIYKCEFTEDGQMTYAEYRKISYGEVVSLGIMTQEEYDFYERELFDVCDNYRGAQHDRFVEEA
ncbi:MAG: hypothetical protein WCT39_06245, partial [Candidatus Margulisiibacteriota bacterium]